jgi:hypothetical protein
MTILNFSPLSSASPVLANGRVLFLNESGEATWIKSGTDFTILGSNKVPGRTIATPAFSDGAMYLRTDESLYKFAE